MRGVLPALAMILLGGCGYDLAGIWQIERLRIGDAEVRDAGFVDLRDYTQRTSNPSVWLPRYWYDVETGELVPDPTPLVLPVSVHLEDVRELDEAQMDLLFPVDPDYTGDAYEVAAPVRFVLTSAEGRTMELVDESFPHGPMTWDLVR